MADQMKCLNDYGEGTCRGPVEMRWSGGMNGRHWARCESHQIERDAKRQGSIEAFADSDAAPDWFDPDAAGERWSDDY